MMPQAGPDAQLATTEQADDTAVIRSGFLRMRVTGRWATPGEESLTVQYRNVGQASLMVDMDRFALASGRERLGIWHAEDMTGVDLTDNNPNNDVPQTLIDEHRRVVAPLRVHPGETRTVSIGFANAQSGQGLQPDQLLTARIAVPGGTVPVRFKTVEG